MGWNLGTSNPNEVGVTWNQGNPTTEAQMQKRAQLEEMARQKAFMADLQAQRAAQAQAMQRAPAPLGPRDFGLTQGQAIPQQGSQGGAPVGGYDPTQLGINYTFPGLF